MITVIRKTSSLERKRYIFKLNGIISLLNDFSKMQDFHKREVVFLQDLHDFRRSKKTQGYISITNT